MFAVSMLAPSSCSHQVWWGLADPRTQVCLIAAVVIVGGWFAVGRKAGEKFFSALCAMLVVLMLGGAVVAAANRPIKPASEIIIPDRCVMHCDAVAAGAESWWYALLVGGCNCPGK